MANELRITSGIVYANGALADTIASAVVSVDQGVQGFHGTVQTIGTSEEDITLGDIATNGWLFLKHVGAANFVTYGPKSAGAMIAWGKLEVGEVAMCRLAPGVVIRAIADTAAVKVLVKAYED